MGLVSLKNRGFGSELAWIGFFAVSARNCITMCRQSDAIWKRLVIKFV